MPLQGRGRARNLHSPRVDPQKQQAVEAEPGICTHPDPEFLLQQVTAGPAVHLALSVFTWSEPRCDSTMVVLIFSQNCRWVFVIVGLTGR